MVTEALPDCSVWPTLADAPHVSELLVEMLL